VCSHACVSVCVIDLSGHIDNFQFANHRGNDDSMTRYDLITGQLHRYDLYDVTNTLHAFHNCILYVNIMRILMLQLYYYTYYTVSLFTLSATTAQYVKPRLRTVFGERAFSFARPKSWNDLPIVYYYTVTSTDSFKRQLKTYLFNTINQHIYLNITATVAGLKNTLA